MTEHDEPADAPTGATVPADPKDPGKGVLAALVRFARPSTPAEISKATGLPEKTVRRTLGRLVAVKDAKRAGGDRFTASKHRS
jgi:hypothetical protein